MVLFKTDIFKKHMVRDEWEFPLFLLIPSQKLVFNKKANVINFQCWINRKPREVRIHWPQVEAALSILTHARKPQFLIYKLLMIHWSPKEITQHQALVSTIFNVYDEYDVLSWGVSSPLCWANGYKGVSFRQNTTMYLNYCIFYYCIQVTSFF